MDYENDLIREATQSAERWCSDCERAADDCVCEEICDHFRETVGLAGDGDVCVPAPSPVPLETLGGDGVTRSQPSPSGKSVEAAVSPSPVPLQLDYPVWRLSFSAYGEHMGWEVPK